MRELLRCIRVPRELQYLFSSLPRPQNRNKSVPLRSLMRYTERWIWIIYQLCGKQPDYSLLYRRLGEVCERFSMTEEAFVQVRFERVHMLSYPFVVMKIFQLMEHLYQLPFVETYRRYWPLPSRAKCQELHESWFLICHYLSWPLLPTRVQSQTVIIRAGPHRKRKCLRVFYLRGGGHGADDGRDLVANQR